MPNQDQLLSVLRYSDRFWQRHCRRQGLVTVDQATMIGDATLTTIGGAATLVPLIWGFIRPHHLGQIAAVTALPDVKKIITCRRGHSGLIGYRDVTIFFTSGRA